MGNAALLKNLLMRALCSDLYAPRDVSSQALRGETTA
jgi:hypothetical protein